MCEPSEAGQTIISKTTTFNDAFSDSEWKTRGDSKQVGWNFRETCHPCTVLSLAESDK